MTKMTKLINLTLLLLCFLSSTIYCMEENKNPYQTEKIESEPEELQLNSLGGLPTELKFIILEFSFEPNKISQIAKLFRNLTLVNKEFKVIINSPEFSNYLKKTFKKIQANLIFVFGKNQYDQAGITEIVINENEPVSAEKIQNWSTQIADKFNFNSALTDILDDSYFNGHYNKSDITKVRVLLSLGADVNKQNEDKDTPLHIAIVTKYNEIAKLFLQAGANPNIKNESEFTILCHAIIENIEAVNLLFPDNENIYKINLNELNGETIKFTSLARAAERSLKVTRTLLDLGANPNIADAKGETVLMSALKSGRTSDQDLREIVKLLLNHGATLSNTDEQGRTALMWALPKIYLPAIDCNSNKRKKNSGEINQDKLDLLHLLLKNPEGHKTINMQDKKGNSALMYAITNLKGKERNEIVKILLSYGADINATNNKGKNVLSIAESHAPELVTLLKEASAV